MAWFGRLWETPQADEDLIQEVEMVNDNDSAIFTFQAQVDTRLDTTMSRSIHIRLPDKSGYTQRDIDIMLHPTMEQWKMMVPGCHVKVTVEVTLPPQLESGNTIEVLALEE